MIGAKYISFFDRGGTGYSTAAKRYIRGLDTIGVPITWLPLSYEGGRGRLPYHPIDCGDADDAELRSFCRREISYDTVIVHTVPEYYPQWVEREPGKRMVGYTVWETDRLPKHWPDLLNAMDLLLVPCAWNKKVFERCGVRMPIQVVPHPIEPPGSIDTNLGLDVRDGDFVFYSINVWSPRKNIEALLEAYLQTFTRDDPVVLVLKTDAWDATSRFLPVLRRHLHTTERSLRRILKRYPNPARVQLITDTLTEAQIRGLHQRGDCYASLCRAEGWGMGASEACAHGNPVIMTGYGGQLDFLPTDASYLVDYELVPVEVVVGKQSYSPDQHWAKANIEHAGKLMRRVFENRQEAEQRGEALREHVLVHFGGETVARQFLAALANVP